MPVWKYGHQNTHMGLISEGWNFQWEVCIFILWGKRVRKLKLGVNKYLKACQTNT